MKRPLAGTALVYATGLGMAALIAGDVTTLLWIVVGLFVTFLLVYRTRWSAPVLWALVLATGMLMYRQAADRSTPAHLESFIGDERRPVIVRGWVLSDAVSRTTFQMNVREVFLDGAWRPVWGRLFVFIGAGDDEAVTADDRRRLRYGDEIETSLMIRPPPPARNPGVFDLADWLQRQGIYLTGSIGRVDTCLIVRRDRGNPLRAFSLRLRDKFDDALRAGLEDEPRLAGVLAGMVIGERAEIPPDTYAAFQRTGAFHVFAISGLHVGLVTIVVVVVLRLLRLPRRWCGLVAIPLLVLYVFATGARPGAVRALVMSCVWLTGWILVRPIDLVNTVAVAALVILVAAPLQLFDGGFVLSFTVVTALVLLTPRFETVIERWLGPDPLVPDELVAPWRKWCKKPARWVARTLAGSLAAWLGLVPLMAIYFNLFTPISVLANVIAVPLLFGILSLGLLSIMVFPLVPALAIIFNNANYFLLNMLLGTVEWLGQVPGGHYYVVSPPLWWAVVYYLAGLALVVRSVAWSTRRWVVFGGVLLLVAAAVARIVSTPPVRVTLLDIDLGNAAFINLRGEQDDFLIDVADERGGLRVVIPFLRGQGVDRLAAVWITRGTQGRLAGYASLAAEAPIGRVVHSGRPVRSKYYKHWEQLLAAGTIPGQVVQAGDQWEIRPGVRLRVLHPAAGWDASRSADDALVLVLDVPATRILFLSDAGRTIEEALLAAGTDLRADVIVVGRHGNEPSCSAAFLDAVQPRVAVLTAYSRGSRSQAELRERLQERAVELFRTDESGAITIELDDHGYSIQPYL